jgi:hypothetical protein
MPKVRIEQIVNEGERTIYHVVLDRPEGQYRQTFQFDHEPSDQEFRNACIEWLKNVKYLERKEVEV